MGTSLPAVSASTTCQCSQSVDIPPLLSLPNEVLEEIVSFLSIKERLQTELVCKRLHDFGKSVRWRLPREMLLVDREVNKINVDKDCVAISARNIPTVIPRCGTNLKRIILHKSRDTDIGFSVEEVKLISTYCANVEELWACDLMNVIFDNLINCCANLKIVCLKLIGGAYYSNISVASFIGRCPKLEILRISNCNLSSGNIFASVSPHLKVLQLDNCLNFKKRAVEHLMARCGSLQEVSFTNFCELDFGFVNEEVLLKISHWYANTLEVVQLDNCDDIEHVNWHSFFENLKILNSFSAQKWDFISRDMLKALAENCAKLKFLDISGSVLDDQGLAELSIAPALKSLSINNMLVEPNSGLETLAARGILEQVLFIKGCLNSDDELECLAWCCPNLHKLDVSGTIGIGDKFIASFRDSMESGIITHKLQLIVGGTSISENVELCENLEVLFEETDVLSLSAKYWGIGGTYRYSLT